MDEHITLNDLYLSSKQKDKDDTPSDRTTSDLFLELRDKWEHKVFVDSTGGSGFIRHYLLSQEQITDLKEQRTEAQKTRDRVRFLLRDRQQIIDAQRQHECAEYRNQHFGVDSRIKTLLQDVGRMSPQERLELRKLLFGDLEDSND